MSTPRVQGLRSLVGNTPLLVIEYRYRDATRRIFAKAENLNLTGSIKDRMALHILTQGYAKGTLSEGDVIVEATSGNTGISFSAIGRALGHPVTIFMPDWMSEERKALISSFGADINLVSPDDGGFVGSIEQAEAFATDHGGAFLPRQFANEDNSAAHAVGTGPEILRQLAGEGVVPDAFVAGVGTGGTIMGVGQALRQHHRAIRLYPLEPSNSPTLSTGHRIGTHRIQGVSDEFIPPIVDLTFLDDIIAVDDGDAIIMAQTLARHLGLGVGISSGANFLGAVGVQNALGDDCCVVTVFPDSNKKYLSTDLLHEEPIKDGFLTPDVELVEFRGTGRVCQMCHDPLLPPGITSEMWERTSPQ